MPSTFSGGCEYRRIELGIRFALWRDGQRCGERKEIVARAMSHFSISRATAYRLESYWLDAKGVA